MKRVLFVTLLAVCAPCSARAETASSHLGIEVEVPPGYTWKEGYKFKPSTVIYLEGPKAQDAPAIVINAIDMRHEVPEADVFKQTREAFPDSPAKEISLASGRYLRVDFELEVPPRKLKQRVCAAIRGTYVYYFFLVNVEAERFDAHTPAFDAVVASARYSKPRPKVATPPAPEPIPEVEPTPKKPPALQLDAGASSDTAPEVEPAPEETAPEVESAPEETPAPKVESAPAKGAVGSGPQVPLKIVRWESEYDPDIWAAAHLLDGKKDRGWCSSPSDKAPFRFVFEVPTGVRTAEVGFDNACPTERGFEGVSAAAFLVEGSNLGPERGYKILLEGKLEPGKNGQRFALPAAEEHRYLRLSLTSNHGHARLTELMEFRAYGPAGEISHAFRLDRVRTSRERNGSAEEQPYRPGERVWVNFKPRALATNDEGSTWLEVDLVLGDSEGNELLRRDKVVNHVAKPPTPPLSPFVSLFLDLPKAFPPGKYVVRLIARDRVADTSAAAKSEFLVGE